MHAERGKCCLASASNFAAVESEPEQSDQSDVGCDSSQASSPMDLLWTGQTSKCCRDGQSQHQADWFSHLRIMKHNGLGGGLDAFDGALACIFRFCHSRASPRVGCDGEVFSDDLTFSIRGQQGHRQHDLSGRHLQNAQI
eukprot:516881-Amphidinium_carterae.1